MDLIGSGGPGDRTVVVTGGASGIGRALTKHLAREGATVVACDIDAMGLESLRNEMAAEGSSVRTVRADITVQDDVDALVSEVMSNFGAIHVVANVAGIMDWFLPAHELDDATWTRVMAVNVDGPRRLCRAVLPVMMTQGRGCIVNVGSVASTKGGVAGLAYTTSKHALVGLTRSIAWTYASAGVRCNIVMPGYVDTGIGATGDPRSEWAIDRLKPVLALSPRRASSEEVASVIAWVASDAAGIVNGAQISADGGWTAT
jgi:NAD(P)-dependent dehydrogenase (short-subunit alcohol dehydrogenase family)